MEKFHELRFNVSRVLREMQVLETRFIDGDSTKNIKQQQPQYIAKYKKLASIAGISKLSQIAADNGQSVEETKTDQ